MDSRTNRAHGSGVDLCVSVFFFLRERSSWSSISTNRDESGQETDTFSLLDSSDTVIWWETKHGEIERWGERRRENCRGKVTTRSWKEEKRRKKKKDGEKIATNLEADKLGWNLQRVYSFYRGGGKGRHEDVSFSSSRNTRSTTVQHEHEPTQKFSSV